MYKILIAESSQQICDLILKCLATDEYETFSTMTGTNALIKAEALKPDLIITGSYLPDMSGFDLCKKIKQEASTADSLTLIISFDNTTSNRARQPESGVDGFIENDISSSLLLSKIRAMLNLKNLKDQLKNKYAELEEKNNILERQLNIAKKIQQSLIRNFDFTFSGSQFLSQYLPAIEIGGDFYDVIDMPEKNQIAVIIGDVSGHGISAALLTSMLLIMLRGLVEKHNSPETILKQLNKDFVSTFESSESEVYACVSLAIIDTKNKKIHFSSAGQVPPIFVDCSKKKAIELLVPGMPIGMMLGSDYEVKEIIYSRDDLLFFHTDGLPDMLFKDAPDDFTAKLKETLLDVTASDDLHNVLNGILASFYNYSETELQKYEFDDVSMIICRL